MIRTIGLIRAIRALGLIRALRPIRFRPFLKNQGGIARAKRLYSPVHAVLRGPLQRLQPLSGRDAQGESIVAPLGIFRLPRSADLIEHCLKSRKVCSRLLRLLRLIRLLRLLPLDQSKTAPVAAEIGRLPRTRPHDGDIYHDRDVLIPRCHILCDIEADKTRVLPSRRRSEAIRLLALLQDLRGDLGIASLIDHAVRLLKPVQHDDVEEMSAEAAEFHPLKSRVEIGPSALEEKLRLLPGAIREGIHQGAVSHGRLIL